MGDGPPPADADAPLGHVPGRSDPVPEQPGKSRRGRPTRGRKHRRHRRRPVYAPGTGPHHIEGAGDRIGKIATPAALPPASVAPAVSARSSPGNGVGADERRPTVTPYGRTGDPTVPFYAALDLGTNNCRLLVAAPRDHGFRVVDAFSRIVRLGEGIAQTGRLSEAAM